MLSSIQITYKVRATLGSVKEGDSLTKNVLRMNETGQNRRDKTLHWLTTPQELHTQLLQGLAAHTPRISRWYVKTDSKNRPITMTSRAVSRVTLYQETSR